MSGVHMAKVGLPVRAVSGGQRPKISVVLILLLLLFPAGALPQGTQHPPVPDIAGSSEPDFTSCTVCHAEKSEAAVVHPALELGCESCHAVDRYKDETSVYLSVLGNDLCFQCHEDKKPQADQPTVHMPVRTETCITCHDAHSSAAPHLLKRASEGRDPASNLCLRCHTNIAELLAKPIEHAAVDMGCSTCHTTHKSEPASEAEGIYHLNSSPPALCLDCHGGDTPALQKAHYGQPVEDSYCAGCHNPHGSDAAKLLKPVAHPPFEARDCEICHAAPKDGKVQLVEGGRRELCLTCHSDVEEALAQVKVTHPPLEMDDGCVYCHSPHATNAPHQLKQGPVRTCFDCHTDLAEARATKDHLHYPAFKLGCPVCHQAHGGQQERLLRAGTNDLCMECHDPGIRAKVRAQERENKPLALFEGKVEVPPQALAGIETIRLIAGQRGHPFIARHPVRGKYQLGDNLSCVTCHTPHAANGSEKLFVTESAAYQPLCQKCHRKEMP